MKKDKPTTVYLSGRMSGIPDRVWRQRFWLAAYSVRQRLGDNVRIVNPAETLIARHPRLYRIIGYRVTLWYDLHLLRRCTHITMVGTDWTHSRGARLERMKARQYGIELLTTTNLTN